MKSLRKLASWYFSKAALPYWSILLLDCAFVFFAGFLSYVMNHGSEKTMVSLTPLLLTLGIFLLCFMVSFRIFHTYDGVIRYSSFSDLLKVSQAVIVGVAIIFVVQWCLSPSDSLVAFGAVDILMMALVTVACMWTVRVIVKTLYERVIHPSDRERVFILGIKDGGVALAKNINSSADSIYKLCGFVTDKAALERKLLLGVKVYPFNESLTDVMRRCDAHALIVTPSMMHMLREDEGILNSLVDSHIKILVMPKAVEWDRKDDLDVSNFHPVDVEDLLPRERIDIDLKGASELIRDKVVMITGAAGSIGSEMVAQIAAFGPSELVLVDQAETPMHDVRLKMRAEWPQISAHTIVADIADRRFMERIFRKYRPEYVFHAAAYKHVPMMEDNPYESVINNVKGTKVIADLAVKYGTKKFVMVSTDKAVNPTNVMGCSKRICEIYVQSLDEAIKEGKVEGQTCFVTTRFGNVLGSNGSVIPLFQEQIRKGGPVTVTHPDIIRYFMLIPEACKLVIEAGTMGKGGEIFVFDMGAPVKIADLARRMIKLSGVKNVDIVYTGLRDGEKLYEEVLNDKEITLPTFHPKIRIAKVRMYEYSKADEVIGELIKNADTMDDMEIVAEMKEIVPEFKSQNSVYQVLDKKDAPVMN